MGVRDADEGTSFASRRMWDLLCSALALNRTKPASPRQCAKSEQYDRQKVKNRSRTQQRNETERGKPTRRPTEF